MPTLTDNFHRIAWRDHHGQRGHGTVWMSYGECLRAVGELRESERQWPERERLVHWAESRSEAAQTEVAR